MQTVRRSEFVLPVPRNATRNRQLGAAVRDTHSHRPREPWPTQIASFVDLFVWLLVFKSFFLPLFIIPTGSMASTLMGAHAEYSCPNCGYSFQVGFHTPEGPAVVQCPNCRFQQPTTLQAANGVKLKSQAGDRIVVHGWPFEVAKALGPRRWDVIVFRPPHQPYVNYIKRMVGLPGETIEIIDGDVFVKGRADVELQPARKTRQAQAALWFPYYDHDYPPSQPSPQWVGAPPAHSFGRQERRPPIYYPRWISADNGGGWTGLEGRTPQFNLKSDESGAIRFATAANADAPPEITDVYGYNGPSRDPHRVTDVRLGADVAIESGDGYIEFVISKYADLFYARLYADGRVTLEHSSRETGEREEWSQTQLAPITRQVHFSIGHADYHVTVEIDGKPVLESDPQQYSVSADAARERSTLRTPQTVEIVANGVQGSLAHVQIARDVHYTSGNLRDVTASSAGKPGTGTQGNPITLRDDAYFFCGDNSPNSLDGRAWSERELGPQLRGAYEAGEYDIGSVPADQIIGRAFFVYWPGFLPVSDKLPSCLPNLGRVRWIH